jgi:tetratricopeptide (TPR) repeat protein
MRVPVTLLIVFALCLPGVAAAQAIPKAVRPGDNAIAARGFEELYNMDYARAIHDFEQLQAQFPNDPFPSNYLLAAVLFQELYRIGALDTETYSGDSFLTSRTRRALDPVAQRRIHELIARVEEQCNARLARNPNDTDALYARGVARGFRATYMGMAEKSWIAAVRSALASRRDHERVLEIDPTYVDAMMSVGIHNYIIGSLNWAGRAMVALVGVTGNKQKGLDYLRRVSRGGGTSANDGAMALALFLRREQRYDEALALVGSATQRSPRNFLLAVEYAHLLNAAGHGREAIAAYSEVLRKGRAGGYSVFQAEVAAWGLGVSLRGQREFAKAAEAFAVVTKEADIDPALLDRAHLAAAEMLDLTGHRAEAVAHYRAVLSGGRDGEYANAARKYLKRPYQADEPVAPSH